MKIAITGDVHFPTASRNQLVAMTEDMLNDNVDAIAIIGDIAEVRQKFDYFRTCLDIFRETAPSIPILVVPGNHDLWVHDSQGWDSRDLLENLLPEATKNAGCHWLETLNFAIDDIAIVGSYLHYDYSAKDQIGPASLLPDEWFQANKHRILNDRFMKGLPSDIEFAKELGDHFRSRLLVAQRAISIEKIVVLSHVPCIEQQITRNPHNYDWSIATPYFGNLSHQDFILDLTKVRFVVSAHSHRRSHSVVQTKHGDVQIINLGADYGRPEFTTLQL